MTEFRYAVAALLLGSLHGVTVQAPGDAPPAAGEQVVLEGVVVTARRINESLQDAPLSISVLEGDRIESPGLVELEDISGHPTWSVRPCGFRAGRGPG